MKKKQSGYMDGNTIALHLQSKVYEVWMNPWLHIRTDSVDLAYSFDREVAIVMHNWDNPDWFGT